MRYAIFTHVDAQTGIPVTIEPARNGPTLPAGCVFGFALESQYPTATPTFYGQTDGPLDTLGILSAITKAQYDAAEAAEMAAREPPPVPPVTVDAERDRRLAAGMSFGDHEFQTDDASRSRIDRSRISAMAAIMGGAQKGDLRWHGLPVDFFWIAADDTRVPMDAQTMVAFGNASAAREGLIIVAGNDLKVRIAAGQTIADITDDALWPA